jgi:hypothetical protein
VGPPTRGKSVGDIHNGATSAARKERGDMRQFLETDPTDPDLIIDDSGTEETETVDIPDQISTPE